MKYVLFALVYLAEIVGMMVLAAHDLWPAAVGMSLLTLVTTKIGQKYKLFGPEV